MPIDISGAGGATYPSRDQEGERIPEEIPGREGQTAEVDESEES